MGGSTTTYRIELVYDVKGNAKAGLAGIKSEARGASQSLGGLKSMLAFAMGAGTFALGKKYLFDYNREIGRMKIGLATVTAMNFHRPFQEGAAAAEKLFTNFQRMAIESPATTKDFVDMANMISSAVLQSGKGLKELESITAGAITASAALGARQDMLALDITQMLQGSLSIRDRYAKQLLAGIGETDIKKFNAYSASKRASLTEKALSTPQLKDAAKAFGESTEGVMSTLQDRLEIALGQVGLPLMKAMTEEVKSWNKWLADNPEAVASMVERVGGGLKEAFGVVKEIVVSIWPVIKDVFGVVRGVLTFVSDHRDILIGAIKALLVYKTISMGMGVIGAAGSKLGGAVGSIGALFKAENYVKAGEGAATAGGAMSSLASMLFKPQGAIAGLSLLGASAWALGKFLFGKSAKEAKEEAEDKDRFNKARNYRSLREQGKTLTERMKEIGYLRQTGRGVKKDEELAAMGAWEKAPLDVRREIEAYEQNLKDTQEAEATLTEQGKKLGLLKESVKDGVRTLTYTGNMRSSPDAAGHSTLSTGTSETDKALIDLLTLKHDDYVAQLVIARQFNEATDKIDAASFNFSNATGFLQSRLPGPGEPGAAPADLYHMTPPAPPKINVNINKIEVASEDPDRFVFGAVRAFEEVVRNPTSAEDTIRGGF